MRPPPLWLLQFFNLLTGFGSLLTANLGIGVWKDAQWSPFQVGMAMTVANLCYAGVVACGGRLADRWGRAKVAIAGSLLSALGVTLMLVVPGPVMALIAAMLAFAGPALYFPGCAGLFSDAEGEVGRAPPPLHAKLSRYNLGWAGGNLGGFLGFGLFTWRPLGYACALAAFLVIAAWMWRWRALPPRPPAADGDRAAHPAVPRLMLIGRCALLIACLLGMALISLVQDALGRLHPVGDRLAQDTMRAWASQMLTAYAAGYVCVFVLLGQWSGWVLRPWRLWAMQVGILVGGCGLLAMAATGHITRLPLVLCGLAIGSGYAAVYKSSIYYSLRSPAGAGRAAGMHETFIGVGNTIGPLVGGLWVYTWLAATGAPGQAMFALSAFVVLCAVALLVFQAALIPGAVRLGAR